MRQAAGTRLLAANGDLPAAKVGGRRLVERGGVEPRSNPDLGYRFEVDGGTVELLGPDGLRSDPKTTSGFKTLQAAGGMQALRRTEVRLLAQAGSAASRAK
ncbi:MAG TPA: hypothetical protein VHE08_07945 [Solirubrobacterales bacterium]|nr:hypothetical protein [Solirubrobacterales bacterium]